MSKTSSTLLAITSDSSCSDRSNIESPQLDRGHRYDHTGRPDDDKVIDGDAPKAVALTETNAAGAGVKLKTVVKSIAWFDFGEASWDLILLSYVGPRGFTEKLERALRPGGVLIIEGNHLDATKGRSIGGGVVFDTGELPRLFPSLRVVRYEEPLARSDFGLEVVRLARYCGERPE